MSNEQWLLSRVLLAAEQHYDYISRSLASETGRYTVGEHEQLWSDILHMRGFIARMEGSK